MPLTESILYTFVYVYREWFGPTTFFDHPSPAPARVLKLHFPTLFEAQARHSGSYQARLIPSTRGETIAQLHDRVATTLAAVIADVDAEIAGLEASLPAGSPRRTSRKTLLICSHAAPLIAMGRALTGHMPEDSSEEDFRVYTAGMSTFVRRRQQAPYHYPPRRASCLAAGTVVRPRLPTETLDVPDWQDAKGVAGGWDCVSNGDCSFLSGGEERGWYVLVGTTLAAATADNLCAR